MPMLMGVATAAIAQSIVGLIVAVIGGGFTIAVGYLIYLRRRTELHTAELQQKITEMDICEKCARRGVAGGNCPVSEDIRMPACRAKQQETKR